MLLFMEILGQHIIALRKQKGWSQAILAHQLGLPRHTLTLIETQKRKISVAELQKVAQLFHLSMDELLDPNFSSNQPLVKTKPMITQPTIRMNIPATSLEKMEQVLLYVLQKCAAKPNVGETVLYKLLYFADFNYYEQYEEHLSSATYRKLQHGPVPKELQALLQQMQTDHKIEQHNTQFYEFAQTRYLPLVAPDLRLLKASETHVVDQVIDQLGDMPAKVISAYSHQDIPWKATDFNAVINYELAFYREAPYSVRQYLLQDDD